MGPPVRVGGAICLLLFVGGSFAGPILKHESLKCENGPPLHRTLKYNYNGVSKIENEDVNQEVNFSAEVLVHVPRPCVLQIKLQNVKSPHQEFTENLQKSIVEVHMDNGVISEFYQDSTDKVWAVNVKRAIASMLQTSLDASDSRVEKTEKDILGICDTTYAQESSDADLVLLVKSKKLLTCQHRFQSPRTIFATPYEAATSEIRTVPLADGTFTCKQLVRPASGVVESAVCQQKEKLYVSQQATSQPGAISVITSEATLELVSDNVSPVHFNRENIVKGCLVFDSSYVKDQAAESLVLAVNRYCEAMKNDVRPETGKLFGDLLKSMRGASSDKIKGVYGMLDSKPCNSKKLRSVFLDILGMAGSPSAVKVIGHLIHTKQETQHHAQWLAAMPYITEPTVEMIEAMIPVVREVTKENAKQVLLAVSAMANTFCKTHECAEEVAIQNLINALSSHLGSDCNGERAIVVATLKAFGNLGQMQGDHSAVMTCVNSKETDIRLYTLRAFRKICDPVTTQQMLAFYGNQDEDVEMRIAAYLNVMKCADFDTLSKVIDIYENEKIHQVGAFVYSHMKNLHDTDCPLKSALKNLIKQMSISDKFSNDPSKFSQNFEYSRFSESVNVGATAEGSVVFTPKSFLPRSATLNLTLDIFSNSINLLELGGRVEGLEKFLEQFIGPNTKLGDKIREKLSRPRRATAKDTDVAQFDNEHENKLDNGEKMAFYVNVYGNEIDYVEYNSMEEFTSKMVASAVKLMSLHPSYLLADIVAQTEIDIAKNVVLVDNSVTASTLTGVGLSIEVRAISSVVLKASIPAPTGLMQLKGSIEPSAVVQIDGSLTLNAGVFRHGARMATTLHTSSVIDVQMSDINGEFKFLFNTPREKIEVLNAKSEIFIIHGDYETPVTAKVTRDLHGCTQRLPEVLGVAACLTGTVPKPWYRAGRGFVKPFNFALTLEKFDKNMKGFEFIYHRDRNSFGFSFDTPGVEGRKRTFTLQSLSHGYRVYGECPVRIFDGKLTSGPDYVDVRITNKQTGKTVVYSLLTTKDANTFTFKATCPYLPEPAFLTFSYPISSRLTIESNYPKENPLNLKAKFGFPEAEFDLSVGDLKAVTKVSINARETWHSVFHTEYTLAGQETQTIHHELKMKNGDVENGYHLSGISTWSMTCHPQYNHKINYDLHASGDSRKHKIQMWWGDNFEDESKTLRINFDAKKRGEFGFGSTTTMQIYVQVFSPVWGLNWDGKYNSKIDLQRSPRITSELYVTKDKESIVKFEFLFDRSSPKTSAKLSLIAPHTRLVVTDDSENLSKGKYRGTTEIEWGFDDKKLTVDYNCQVLGNGNHDLKLDIRAPNMKPITHRHLIRVARDIQLETQTTIDGKDYIVFEIKKEDNSLAFNLLGQKNQIRYSRVVKDKAVDVKLTTQSILGYQRPISLVIHKDSPGKKNHILNVEFKWDAVANPDKKLSIALKTDREDGVKSEASIDITNIVNFHYKGTYVKGFIKGPNRAEFHLSGPNIEARELIVGHVHSTPKGEGYLKYTRGSKVLVDAKGGHEFTDEKRHYFFTLTGLVNRKLTITRDLTNRVLTVDLDRDGKIYGLVIDRKSDLTKGLIDSKITLKTPYENFKSQVLTSKGTFADGKVDVTVHYLSGTNKNYNFVIKGTRPGKLQLDVEIDIKTDNEKLKEGKAILKYKLDDATNRHLKVRIESAGEAVFDLQVESAGTDFYNREAKGSLSSKFTPSFTYNAKITGSKEKFNTKTTVTKNNEPYYNGEVQFEKTETKLALHLVAHGGFFGGDTDLQFERNILPGDNHRTYKLDVKRNERELKADAETQRENGFKLTSVNICRTPLDSNCVSFVVKRNIDNFNVFRNNALNVKIHRKPDVTVEVDGQLHIPADVHKAHVRLVGNINEFKLGVDYTCDHSTEQVSEQVLKGYIVDRELLATRRREQTDKLVDIKYTATFDSRGEERLEATYRRDYNEKGYKSVARLAHPKMRNPITLTSELSRGKDANSIIRLESELDWAKPEDKLFFHYERRVNDETPRNRSLHVHVHKQDKTDYDLQITLYRSEDLKKPVFAGYYWSYITAKKEQRAGSLKAFLGEDLKGYIDFTSPYQDNFKITGEAKVINDQGDKEAEIVHLKNGVETRGKISYNVDKLYLKAVVLDDKGADKRELEIDGGRKEKGRYKIILSSFPDGKRTTDLGIEHSRTSETSYHSRVYAPPEYLSRVVERAKAIAASRIGKYPIEEFKEEIKTRFDSFSFKLRKVFEDVPEYLLTKISNIFVEIQGSLTRLINNTTVGQQLKKKLEENREKINAIIRRIIALVRECCPKLASRLESFVEKFVPKRARRSVQQEEMNLIVYVTERIQMFKTWLMDLPPVHFAVEMYNKTIEGIEWFKSTVQGWANKIKNSILDLPDIKQIAKTWTELYDSSSVGYMMPRDAIMTHIIKPRMQGWMARAPVFEYDSKTGRFVADVDVPVDASDIIQYWAYGTQPRKQRQNTFDMTKSESALDMVIDTFTDTYDGHATIIDGKHFVTFDGKHFSASGECSYLLARDFANGSFSIIHNPSDQSYTLQLGKLYIEVEGDRFSVNGNFGYSAMYDLMGDDVSVKESNAKIEIITKPFKFTWFKDRNIVTISLRVWYFGKTAGLLGNYNRETIDDFATPSGEKLTDEREFMKAWETKECTSDEPVLFRTRTEDVDAVELCEKVFKKEESTMAFGFLLHNTDRFYDLCLRVAESETRKIDAVCRVAQAYLLDLERSADIPRYLGARLPNECLTCELPGLQAAEVGRRTVGKLETGESADVVFIVQDNACNAQLGNNISALARSLDKQLTSKDILKNRYGLVSFGAQDELNEARVQTVKGQLYFSARSMQSALNRLDMTSQEIGDTFSAIQVALTQFEFRPTAAKILVLFSCQDCEVIDKTAPDAMDIRTALHTRGVTFHVVSQRSVRVRGSASKKAEVLGLDHEGVYTAKDIQQLHLAGRPGLRQHVFPPKEACAALAMDSSGSWFRAPKKIESRVWRTLMAKRISQDVITEEECVICECTPATSYSTKVMCKPCKPRRATTATNDYDDYYE